MLLLGSAEERMKAILNYIFSKFGWKVSQEKKKVYYHSADIFREIGPESEDEESEAEATYLERDLERCRISDFTDVNKVDKSIF